MKKVFLSLLLFPLGVLAAEGGYRLDASPHDVNNLVSLQSGARTFVNYCLGCHGAQYVRYKSLTELGIPEAQIR
jgi:ubiquinol-cytochrome c reductase cytochrome c1 subunit